MNKITLPDAHAAVIAGYTMFSHAPKGTDKSKSFMFYPYREPGKQYVAHCIDETGDEPVELKYEGSLANAALAYNDYDVGDS